MDINQSNASSANIGNSNLVVDSPRTLDLDGFDLDFTDGATSRIFIEGSNGNVGINTTAPSARFEVKLQGATSGDIGRRVVSSSGSVVFEEYRGDGTYTMKDAIGVNRSNHTLTDSYMLFNGSNFYQMGSENRVFSMSNSFQVDVGTSKRFVITQNGSLPASFYKGAFQMNTTLQDPGSATNVFLMEKGVNPSGNLIDHYWQFAGDNPITGKACFATQNEDGEIFLAFKGAALTANDGSLGNAHVRIDELEARLQANGLLT